MKVGQEVWLEQSVDIGGRTYTTYYSSLIEWVSRDGFEFEADGRYFRDSGHEMVDRRNANGGRWLYRPTCFFENPEASHSFGYIFHLAELHDTLDALFNKSNDGKVNAELIKSITRSVKAHARKHHIKL